MWADQHFNMEQKFWEVALTVAQIKTRLDFFHGKMDGDGTLEWNPLNFTASIKLSTNPILPWRPMEIMFLYGSPKLHFYS